MGTARARSPYRVDSRPVTVLLADAASKMTIGLIITFGGIGLIVNGLLIYIAVLVLGERADNRAIRGRRLGSD